MFKRVLIAWAIANFLIVGIASWIVGRWYLGWQPAPVAGALAELGLIMLPNLVLPILVLRYGWIEPVGNLRAALGWQWNGWRSPAAGALAFVVFYLLLKGITLSFGSSIPYNLPGTGSAGMAVNTPGDILKILGILMGLVVFITFTVAAEETMFRGWIQTQVGNRLGAWAGILTGALLFGLRHLPADIFYARAWQATPQMWLSRQVQLYALAFLLGLTRHIGKSTYASTLMHGLIFVVALFGLG